MNLTKTVNLDFFGNGRTDLPKVTISAKQGDTQTRFLRCILQNGTEAWQFPEGVAVQFRCVKPDGHSCDNPAVINEDGTVTVELTDQVLAVPGHVMADLSFLDMDGGVLSTMSFGIWVEPVPQGKGIPSTNEFLTLQNLITEVRTGLDNGDFEGEPGKTAYQYALDGGYTGTEAEFAEKMAEEAPKAFYVTVIPLGDGTFVADKTFEEIEAAYAAGCTLMTVYVDTANSETIYHGLAMYIEGEMVMFAQNLGEVTSVIFIAPEEVFCENVPVAPEVTMQTLTLRIGTRIVTYDGTTDELVNVQSLKNPYSLTINGVSYDGSEAVDFTDTINAMIDAKLGVIENGAY